MAATTALLTVDEFLELPEVPGVKRELREGIVIEMSGANLGHEIVKAKIHGELHTCVRQTGIGTVFSEMQVVLSESESYIPDVALILTDRLARADRTRRFQGAPDLAVEVVSSESAADLEHKIRSYLRHGSRAVWVAYPDERVLRVCSPEGQDRILTEGMILEAPDLLPGFSLPISGIFEGL